MGSWRSVRIAVWWAVAAALLTSGCRPEATSAEEEEARDPHFVAGEVKKRAMDYSGAAEAFEKALQNNPRSAAAHAELGLLYHEKLNQPIPALYHLDRYLLLKPDSNKSDAIRLHMTACKQDLVRDIPMGSLSAQVQTELEKLIRTNTALLQENEKLRTQIAQFLARPMAPSNSVPEPGGPASLGAGGSIATNPPARPTAESTPGGEARAARSPSGRTHVVKPGENPSSIARQYGITASALLTANPGVDPRKLRVGQTLSLPSR